MTKPPYNVEHDEQFLCIIVVLARSSHVLKYRSSGLLADEIRDLSDQLGEGGKNVHDLDKACRRLALEKDELQNALEEAEAALEQEEAKVMRAQLEATQLRTEADRRVQEKEEEFDTTRKTHQRAIESLQALLYEYCKYGPYVIQSYCSFCMQEMY